MPDSMQSVGGVTVSMVAFQAVDPGSTPGRRTFFISYFELQLCWLDPADHIGAKDASHCNAGGLSFFDK